MANSTEEDDRAKHYKWVRALRRRAQMWAPFSAKRYLGGIRLAGAETREPSAIAQGLAQYWGNVFGDPMLRESPPRPQGPRELELQEKYLQKHCDIPEEAWLEVGPPTRRDLTRCAERAKPTSPGVDGLPAIAWTSHTRAVDSLEKALHWQLLGLPMRSAYNHVLGVFVPKGDDDRDSEGIVRAAEDTRPLSLKNCSNKVVMAATNARVKS